MSGVDGDRVGSAGSADADASAMAGNLDARGRPPARVRRRQAAGPEHRRAVGSDEVDPTATGLRPRTQTAAERPAAYYS